LFGGRQGRILSARFNTDGTLIVRASDIFDINQKNQEGFDLFMRYYYCEPKDATAFDSIAPVNKSASPTITSAVPRNSGIDETSITSFSVSENVPHRVRNMATG
jgi:hypothetical protein